MYRVKVFHLGFATISTLEVVSVFFQGLALLEVEPCRL